MAKIKIHELAKELDIQSKDIVSFLKEKGSDIKNHMSNIEDTEITLVRGHFNKLEHQSKTPNKIIEVKEVENKEEKRLDRKPEREIKTGKSQGGEKRLQGQEGDKRLQDQKDKRVYSQEGDKRLQGQGERDKRVQNTERKPQNQGEKRKFNQDGNRQGGERRYNQDPNRQGGERRYNQDPNRQGGERKYNSDGNRQGGERKYNSDGNRQGGERRYNQDPNRQGGERKYNSDGNRQGGERKYNSDGNRQGGERRYNQDPNRQGGERKYNSDGNRQGGERKYNSDGNRQGGEKRYSSDKNRQSNEKRPYSQGERRQNGTGRGNFGSGRGYDKDMFDKDSSYSERGFSRSRSDSKRTDKSLISDLPNLELTKEQRTAAFNDRNRDRNRERERERSELEDGKKNAKGKKDPNRKGAFIMPKPKPVEEQKEDEIKTIIIPEVLTIQELADKMKKPASAVVKKLFLSGEVVTINQEISFEKAEEIAAEFNCIAEKEVQLNLVEELLKEEEEEESLLKKRPPVVCVMGHVDHGKTSLLDAIRESNVTAKEAGGITQHIGAYVVEINGEKITFLDTPGHEAFTSMRMRGAQATDIAILVIAADDGVMPQTVEAISHAKAAGVQIIVAINKIDKPSANIERVKQELTEHGLVAEDWGGDTVFVPVSAHTKEGIDTLLEMILLTAEVSELKANPNRRARGIVIEAELDKGRGTVATILVQKGILHVGDNIAVGASFGKVRAMMDDRGRRVKEAGPSMPVEILGLNEVPNAGEIFIATENEKEARTISEAFIKQGREKLLADTKAKLSLDGLFFQIKAGNIKELNIIVKADVQGSVEAVKQSLLKLSNEEVAVRIIHGGVGAINESDVTLAATSSAIIIGFNVRPDNTAREIAEREKVDLRMYRVIYDAITDIESAMKGLLDPTFEEKVIGHAEVRQTFKASGLGVIAGSYVLDGKIVRGCSARITRNGDLLFDGALASLKRFKDDVKEVASGYECGLVFEKFNDLSEGDLVELYMMVEVPR